MRFKLSKKTTTIGLYVAGGLLLVVAAVLWCTKISNDPERVFWKTIERGLATQSVTVEADQTANGTTTKQVVRYSLGANNLSHSLTTLSQQGTTVQNEMIGTPTTDYTRYAKIVTDQKKADGSPIDVSKVVGVWAKGQEGGGQFFAQALFGGSLPIGGMGVPIGNIAPETRAALMQQIRNDHAYEVVFSKTKKERVNGRLQYTYDLNVQPVAYVALMKEFSQSIGLHGLDELDPKSYEGQKPFRLQMTVDVKSHQVVRMTEPESGVSQAYSGYGIPVQVTVPAKAISGNELQQLLAELQ